MEDYIKEYEKARQLVQEEFAGYGNGHSEYMVVDVNADIFLDWAARMSLDETFKEPIAGVSFKKGDDGTTVAFFSACETYAPMLCPVIQEAFPNARVYGFGEWDACCFVAPPKAYKTSLAECFSDGENLRLDVRITDKKSGCGSSIGDLICFDSSEEIDDVDEDDTYSFLIGLLNKNEKKKVAKALNECRDFLAEDKEIVPTRAERKQWRENLYNTLMFLSTERPEFRPRKKDNLETLKDSFFFWADEYNDGYFNERDEADTSRYCAWLVQEFDRWAGYHYDE